MCTCVHIYTCTCTLCKFVCKAFTLVISAFRDIEWSSDLNDVDVAPFVQPVGPATILPPTVVEIFRMFSRRLSLASLSRRQTLMHTTYLGIRLEISGQM